MLKIGSLKLKSNLILAPMAGISDLPFRMLNRSFGAELGFVEMINCRSVSFKSKRTHQMLRTGPKDSPLGVQLLGCEDEYILKALEVINKGYSFDLLDFNAACPARKVVRRGEGSGLLRQPKKLHALLALVVKNTKVPVTVKIRAGWDKDSINAREIALFAQDAGVQGIFIHGRTKVQGYSGSVDYNAIRQVKKAVSVPVIASGDIFTPQLIKKMFDETGCDGVAVARGCLGSPWIFKEAKEYMSKGRLLPHPTLDEIMGIMIVHLDSCIDFYGERIGTTIFRKFFSWYTKGLRKIRPLREKSSRAKTKNQMFALFKEVKRVEAAL